MLRTGLGHAIVATPGLLEIVLEGPAENLRLENLLERLNLFGRQSHLKIMVYWTPQASHGAEHGVPKYESVRFWGDLTKAAWRVHWN